MNSPPCSATSSFDQQTLSPTVDRVRGPVLRRALWLTTVAWLFGSVWMNTIAGTPQTNFAIGLGASSFEFGVLAALPFLATLFSLPASLLIEATGKRKGIFLAGLYFQRLMWIPIAVIPMWMLYSHGGKMSSHTAMLAFLGLIFLMHIGQAVGGPAWVSWMADLVPDRCRGKYFGRRRQWGIVTSLPAGWLVGWLLDRYGGGQGSTTMMWACAVIFVSSAAFGFMDIFCFQFVPAIPAPPRKGTHVFKAWREPLRNFRFMWFAGYIALLTCAFSPMGQFVTLYIMQQLGGAHGGGGNMLTQLMLIVFPGLAQLLVFSVWGRAADRMGKRPLLMLAGLGLVPVSLGWCFVTSQTVWLGYLLSALGGALWAGVDLTNLNLVLEFAGSDENNGNGGRSGYVAINSVIINVAGLLGGLLWGSIAQWLQHIGFHWTTSFKVFSAFDVLFVLSAGLRLLAVVVFLPFIHEPEARPALEVFRFMTVNIYNNLFNAIFEPLRFMGLKKRGTYPAKPEAETGNEVEEIAPSAQ